MNTQRMEFGLSIGLVIYLLFIGIGATGLLIMNFPVDGADGIAFPHEVDGKSVFYPFGGLGSIDQGFLIIATLAGIAGSFIHAAQSLSSYIGNQMFKASWTAWYFLRPWIGGILGFAIYFAFRAGLIAGTGTVNPYGVLAIGLLGGWFSKTTTDKLQEVFETLFKTQEDDKRKHKLTEPDEPTGG
ncbi:MAG: hypothetical protein R3281_17865 [Balneolaceae bacterium]|nr:hypothetical protein [Balneolaceae bacterium]